MLAGLNSGLMPCYIISDYTCLSMRLLLCTGWSFSMGSAYQFHSWRVFVVVCALPCVSAVVALTFMPESPRFYLEVREIQRILCHTRRQLRYFKHA